MIWARYFNSLARYYDYQINCSVHYIEIARGGQNTSGHLVLIQISVPSALFSATEISSIENILLSRPTQTNPLNIPQSLREPSVAVEFQEAELSDRLVLKLAEPEPNRVESGDRRGVVSEGLTTSLPLPLLLGLLVPDSSLLPLPLSLGEADHAWAGHSPVRRSATRTRQNMNMQQKTRITRIISCSCMMGMSSILSILVGAMMMRGSCRWSEVELQLTM